MAPEVMIWEEEKEEKKDLVNPRPCKVSVKWPPQKVEVVVKPVVLASLKEGLTKAVAAIGKVL